MQSLAQTQLLLQNVWAENYHDFGEFVPDNLAFNFPTTQDLFTRNMDLSRLPAPAAATMPMKFPDVLGKLPKYFHLSASKSLMKSKIVTLKLRITTTIKNLQLRHI